MKIKLLRKTIEIRKELHKYIIKNYKVLSNILETVFDNIQKNYKEDEDSEISILIFAFISVVFRNYLENKNDTNELFEFKSLNIKILKYNKNMFSKYVERKMIENFNNKNEYWKKNNLLQFKQTYIKDYNERLKMFYSDTEIRNKIIEDVVDYLFKNIIAEVEVEDKNTNTNKSYCLDEKNFLEIKKVILENSNFSGLNPLFRNIFVFLLDLLIEQNYELNLHSFVSERTKILNTLFNLKNYEIENIIKIDSLETLDEKIAEFKAGKTVLKIENLNKHRREIERQINTIEMYYECIFNPLILGIMNYNKFLQNENRQYSKKDEIFKSFKIKKDKEVNVLRIIDFLCIHIDFLDEEVTTKKDLIDVLTSNDLTTCKTKIKIGVDTIDFKYFVREMKRFFYNFNPTTIEKSNLFWSKNDNLIKSNTLQGRVEKTKNSENIDKIIKENT